MHHVPVPHAARRLHAIAEGVWRLADPKIALASLVPFAAGTALAFDLRGTVDWSLAAAAYVAIFLVEAGKNAVNDLYDFRSGADSAVLPDERSPFSGGKRTLVDAVLTEEDLIRIAGVAFALAGFAGIAVARNSDARLLLLGGLAAVVSILYVMPPVKLAYRGLGELAVGLIYGPGILLGAVLVQGAGLTREMLAACFTLGLLIALVLIVNEIPDARADASAGKRTLVVRLGREGAESLMALLFAIAYAVPTILVAYGIVPIRVSALLAGLPFAVAALEQVQRSRRKPPVAGQALTLVTYVVSGTAYAVAVALVP